MNIASNTTASATARRYFATASVAVVVALLSVPAYAQSGYKPKWDPSGNSCPCPNCNPGGNASSASIRDVINPRTGEVIRYSYVNGVLRSRTRIGRATLQYNSAGKPFFVFAGQSVAANRPSLGSTGDPGVDLAIGILSIIEAATR